MWLTILGALLGAILSYLISEGAENLRLRRKQSFLGVWMSEWLPSYDPHLSSVKEELQITVRRGKIHLRTKQNTNSGGFDWEGYASIVEDKFLIGRWRSVCPGAHASGTFTLSLDEEGNFMCGCFLAPNSPGNRIVGAFVLGRDLKALETAKQRLRQVDFRKIPPAGKP